MSLDGPAAGLGFALCPEIKVHEERYDDPVKYVSCIIERIWDMYKHGDASSDKER